MNDTSFIESFYESHRALYQYLMDANEITFATDLNATFCRSLVLAIASFFEHEITGILKEVPARHAGKNPIITSMIEKQVVSRKYHTYFDWDELKANKFFALFGEKVRNDMQHQIKTDSNVSDAMKAFLELGQLRNKLVHQNFVTYVISKTPEELIAQFRAAVPFLEFIRINLSLPCPPEPI